MRKLFGLITSSVIALSSVFFYDIKAYAYEQPTDIMISIETKEIDIQDIPQDRTITLDICAENLPPFMRLSFLLEKDSRLEYLPYRHVTPEYVENMGSHILEVGTGAYPDVVVCTLCSQPDTYIDFNGVIAKANLIIPEDAQAGDFYSVKFLRSIDDNGVINAEIILDNDPSAVFGNDSFSEFTDGGIIITQQETPPAEEEPQPPAEENPAEEEPQPPAEEETPQPPAEESTDESKKNETQPVVAPLTESKKETVTTTTTTTTTITTTAKITSSSSVSKLSTTQTTTISSALSTSAISSAVSENSTTTLPKTEKKKISRNWIPISAVTISAVGISLGIIFRKRKF